MLIDVPTIEFMILANSVEVRDGMLYLLGGTVNTIVCSPVSPFSLRGSIGIKLPWACYNLPFKVNMCIEDSDRKSTGDDTDVPFMFNTKPNDYDIPDIKPIPFYFMSRPLKPGVYNLVARIKTETQVSEHRSYFRVRHAA